MSEKTNVETVETIEKVKETKECPICHKQVSAKKGPFAMHLKKCQKSIAPKVEQPVVVEKPTAKKTDLSKVTSAEVRNVMERAAKVQDELRRAPQVFVGAVDANENETLVQAYAPECISRYDAKGKPINTHTAYIGDERQIQADVAKGYEPVLNEQGEFARNSGGDILYRIPREITEAKVARSQLESRSRLGRVTRDAIRQEVPNGLPSARDGDLKEEALGRVSEITFNSADGLK